MTDKKEAMIKSILKQQAIIEPSSGFNERLSLNVTQLIQHNISQKNTIRLSYGKAVLIMLISLNVIILLTIGFTAIPSSIFIPLIFFIISTIITIAVMVPMIKKIKLLH